LAFLRFVVSTIDADSGVATGVFQVASRLKDSADIPNAIVRRLRTSSCGVIFWDDQQVVAEPFADSEAGA